MRRRAGATDEIRLRLDEFRALRELFIAKTGIAFGPEVRFAIERRLRDRITTLGFGSFSEYCDHLRFSPTSDIEWEEAIDLCTVNQTYFYREAYQLRSFEKDVLPRLFEQARPKKRLLVWSAGCSTGEETYTLAMLLLHSGLFEGWDLRVYGSDISRRCVAEARRGVYGSAAVRELPESFKQRFLSSEGETFQVAAALRELCQFGQFSLLDEDKVHLVGRCDAIFCRNVLIYFGAEARRRVIQNFYDRLVPGGVLHLGHSESLLNVSTAFELLHLSEDLAYRKPSPVRSPAEGQTEDGR